MKAKLGKRFTLLPIVLLAMSVALIACTSTAPEPDPDTGAADVGAEEGEAVVEEADTEEQPAPEEETAAGEDLTLGAVQMVAFHEWFRTVEMGMQDAADEVGVELLVGNAEGQVDTEASLVEDFVARGVDAILISALDSSASVAALEHAVDEGAVLINYNTTIDSPIMETFIGVDNYELGAQAGRWVLDYVEENMGGEAKIALLTIPAYEVGRQRREGFVDVVSENPNIEIVAEQEGESPEQAAATMETILQGNPDIDLVWAANEGGTVGALVGTEGTDIKVVGTDMSLQVAKALLDAENGLLAISTQDPYSIGYESVQAAVARLRGEEVPKETLVPVQLYEKSNPAEVEAYLEEYEALANE